MIPWILALTGLAVIFIYAGTEDSFDTVAADPGTPAAPDPVAGEASALSSIALSSAPVAEAVRFSTLPASSPPAAEPLSMLSDDAMTLKPYTPPAAAGPYLDALRAAEVKYSIPQNLLVRQADIESGFNPRAVSSAGAQGISQFMPGTAKDLSVDPFDPYASIDAQGRYMLQLFTMTGSWLSAVAAYNWGVGNVLRRGTANMPTETVKYVAKITKEVPLT